MSELGDALRDERRRQGKRIPDIEAGTHIRRRLIEALEKGEYERLPNAAYVKGYILSYARCLDIPAAPLLELFAHDMATREPRSESQLPFPIPEIKVARRDEVHAIPWRVAFIIAAAVAVLILVIWGIGRLFGPSETSAPAPLPHLAVDGTAAVAPSSGEGTVPGVVDETPIAEPRPAPAADPFQLKVVVKQGEASWLVITVDGKEAYKGTLTGGQRQYAVTAKATVAMGRPSAVSVYRDGEPVTQKPAIIANVPTLVLDAD